MCGNSLELFDHALAEIIENKQYDLALIHPSFDMCWVDAFSLAMANNFPLIFYDYQDIPDVFSKIGVNHFEIGFLAAKVLQSCGYRKALYLGYKRNLNCAARLRWQGFDTGCRFFNLDYVSLEPSREDMKQGFAALDQKAFAWLEQFRGKQWGIFASTGTFAFQTARYSLVNKVKFPDEFGFLSTDFSVFDGLAYQLSYIYFNFDQMTEQILKLIKQTAGSRNITENLNINITPIYSKGETL